jgi:hypothetical protein
VCGYISYRWYNHATTALVQESGTLACTIYVHISPTNYNDSIIRSSVTSCNSQHHGQSYSLAGRWRAAAGRAARPTAVGGWRSNKEAAGTGPPDWLAASSGRAGGGRAHAVMQPRFPSSSRLAVSGPPAGQRAFSSGPLHLLQLPPRHNIVNWPRGDRVEISGRIPAGEVGRPLH